MGFLAACCHLIDGKFSKNVKKTENRRVKLIDSANESINYDEIVMMKMVNETDLGY